jgi:hypothetical protein
MEVAARDDEVSPACVYRDTAWVDATTCPRCGRALLDHDRHVRFTLPDPVLALPEREMTPGAWMDHTNARDADMMQVPDVGAFIRALLPVHLTEGHQITYGVWLAIHPGQLPDLFDLWQKPAYAALQLDGWLANAISPWGLLAAPVHAVVRDPGHTPYCDSSGDPTLNAVLHDVWPHETVLLTPATSERPS